MSYRGTSPVQLYFTIVRAHERFFLSATGDLVDDRRALLSFHYASLRFGQRR